MSIKSSIPMTFGRKDQDDFSISRLNYDGSEKKHCAEHWHDCFELIFVQSGHHHVTIGAGDFILTSGQIAVISPYTLHSTEGIPGKRLHGIVFGYTESLIYSSDISFSNMKYLAPFRHVRAPRDCILSGDSPELARLRELLCRGAEEYFGASPTRELVMHSIILEVHAILYKLFMFAGASSRHDAPDSRSLSYILDAQSFIESHLTEDISPYSLAESLHISYSHLSRLCKSTLSMTVTELICRMRMNLAEQLFIEDRSLGVTECAIKVGFSSVSYFIRQFRRIKGITPGEFRDMLGTSEQTPLSDE